MTEIFKRLAAALAVLGVCLAIGLAAYHRYLRKVRIAFVGYRDTTWAAFEEAGRRTPYAVHRFGRDELASAPLSDFDAVFVWAMGLNLDEAQTLALAQARRAGAKIIITGATDAASEEQSSLNARQKEIVQQYLQHGGQENLEALLHYVAAELVGRDVEVPPVVEKPQCGYFHLGEGRFETIDAFERHITHHAPRLADDAPRVALFGPFARPANKYEREPLDYLIQSFERRGVRVYPIFGFRRAPELLRQAKPDLAIVFPHGRLLPDNRARRLLARLNIPCLSALSLSTSIQQWLADQRGVAAGALSQSITMPELDGVIEPIAISARQPNQRGIRVPTVIRDRSDRLIDRAMRWLSLRRKPNAEKRIAIVYYKAPGLSALSSAGMETCPSLWNLLRRMEKEGYDLGGPLPESPEALFALIQEKGKTLGQWAIGSYEQFLEEAEPEMIPAETYAQWFQKALPEKRQKETIALWGPIPGRQMVAQREGRPHLIVSRIRFGNVVIMPQPTVGGGGEDEDQVKTIHGTDQAPPHFYIAAYLWIQHGFRADAVIHFGTHGSLEFTRGKSACLSRYCWPDILIGDLPHIYPYIINNVGEAMVAKRRSCAVIVSHLTPPLTAAGLYGQLSLLHEKLHAFRTETDPQLKRETRKTITRMFRQLDLAKDLDLREPTGDQLLSDEQIARIDDYVHELKDRTVTHGLHVLGRPYSEQQIVETVTAMLSEPACDLLLEHAATGSERHRHEAHDRSYHERHHEQRDQPHDESHHQETPGAELAHGDDDKALVQSLVAAVLAGRITAEKCFSRPELAALRKLQQRMADSLSDGPMSGKTAGRGKVSAAQAKKLAFLQALDDIHRYADHLRQSPQRELDQILGALDGAYVPSSPGGDPVVNPDAVPTGRNLYSINAERTPSEEAWRVGKTLADQILRRHKAQTGRWPRQVAFSLWGSEFIRGKGTTLAQILYLIGVRPVRNSRGTVHDVELIPAEQLGRPRIDVLVQTSGQFRDAGASRIALLDRAIRMVASLPEENIPNFVRDGTRATEQALKQLGFSPKEARRLSTARIFGSAGNQRYGTGIMGLVEKGDRWEDDAQVAEQYLRNMGGVYRNEEAWGTYHEGLLAAAMQGTEVVIHPRSSNTWGPLSLDHVYEFMGGITASIRHNTGRDPAGYFNDLRRPGSPKATTAVAAIREEARTTLWNPKYLKGLQREGPSAAAKLTETVRNMYGWNVMQPSAIGPGMWDETYRVLIEDEHELQMREYFEQKNPYALQDLTAVMLETVRKGYWSPSPQVLEELARLHAELVAAFGAGCSYETCGNGKLQEFLRSQLTAPGSDVPAELADAYAASLAAVLRPSAPLPEVEGIQLEETIQQLEAASAAPRPLQTIALAGCMVLFAIAAIALGASPWPPQHV